MKCDCMVGWKIVLAGLDEEEELYFPVFESDEEDELDEVFLFCPFCSKELQ